MKYLIPISIFIFSSFLKTSFALEYEKKDGAWLVRAVSCNELISFVSNVSEWTGEGEIRNSNLSLCKKVNGSYELDLATILPDRISRVLEAGITDKNGHNCWNFSLYAHRFTSSLRYSGEGEFSHVLEETGACEKISNSSESKAGDIVALRVVNRGVTTDLHTYVYLDNDLMIHKRGSLPDHPYEVARSSEVDFKYKDGLEKSCSKCIFKKEIYRCDNSRKKIVFESLDNFRKELSEIECLHSHLSNPNDEIHHKYKEKSMSLKRLVSSSLEKRFDDYMSNKDKDQETAILNDINAWLLIKLQLKSMDFHN